MEQDARYQFRFRHEQVGVGRDSEYVYADYGNEGNVYFSDDFESGDLSAWDDYTDSGSETFVGTNLDGYNGSGRIAESSPEEGSYALQMAYGDYVQKNLGDLSSESNVIVKAYVQSGSLDTANEINYIRWYDGSAWNDLASFGYEHNKQGWVEVTAAVPDSMLSTDNRVRFIQGGGSGGYADFFAVDRVVVSDILHEYTTPSAPSDLQLDASTTRELTGTWTNGSVTNTAPGDVETSVGPVGGALSDVTHSPGTTSYTATELLDGERYTLEVATTIHQYRHGAKSSEWGPTRTTQAATTILPAPTDGLPSNVGETTADYSWTPNANHGTITVQLRHDNGDWVDAVTGLDNTADAASFAGLLHGERYEARAVAVTEHTQSPEDP
ncbi:fibronectin type III domain-containing protein [Halobacterium sp. CBA1126]|uniref:fibronectin type III domain-containing protein n=1 Tax=Halobacterium sp. CBA1126 TaxID=2668074 RepID=UPI001E5905FC|nr:fibronectin type III domain-containing protein [Halobacterium sp. CBA1126]